MINVSVQNSVFVDGLLKYVTQSMSNIGNIDWYVHQYIAIHP